MKVEQFHLSAAAPRGGARLGGSALPAGADLLLVFGAVADLESPGLLDMLREEFPGAHMAGCSTAGQISGKGVSDGSVAVTAIKFERPSFRVATTEFSGHANSRLAGERLAQQLVAPGLHHIVVFGQGVDINGSALIEGIAANVGAGVMISGGLAGDGDAFRRTVVVSDSGVSDHGVVGIGFYGDSIHISHGSYGGWQPFGPARRVTRSAGNILYELDDAPALDVYKRYLGDYANELPSSGLLFPFAMLGPDHNEIGLIRTILGVNEEDGSLVLAGDIDADGYLQLMHASSDALVDGAHAAASQVRMPRDRAGDALALLVSCVGRRLVMGDCVDEEVEAVAEVLGKPCVIAGFYSYGEISPFLPSAECKLHNQTMTISCWHEAA